MKPKQQRMALIIAGVLSLMLGTTLVLYNFRSNMVFFYSPTELQSNAPASSQVIRIGGLVQEGSIKKHENSPLTDFVITDGNNKVTVQFSGILPALFREGQGMVAKGTLRHDGIFIAEELLAKHDENYMPKEVADALKKSGHWQPEK